MIWIKTEEENVTVTGFYLQIIGRAFDRLNQQVTYTSKLNDIKPKSGDTVVFCTAPCVRSFLRRDIRVIYWAQGVWPEESFMRHSGKMRFFLTGAVERTALKRADFVFFVSDHMRAHFEKKYKLSFGDNYYVMPCSNDSLHAEAFEGDDKYRNKVFCYAGATSVWQCFEETIALYSKIEQSVKDTKLLLLVKNKELAEKIIEKYQVKNYEIDYVSVDQLPDRLKGVKYGFLLRKPSVVNAVATPTKTLTYISSGVIPVYSNCLHGISEIFSGCNYKIEVREGNELDAILKKINEPVNNKEILEEYRHIYHKYYDEDAHIERIMTKFKKLGFLQD